MKNFLFIISACILSGNLFAQDTMRKREVSVTSTFKPELKDAAKINFNPTPPTADTTRPKLRYSIPNQNLQFAYQPGSLKPLALRTDTMGLWPNSNYAKVGYGSLNTPYFETGLSIGNPRTAGLNIYGRHIGSKGKIDYQDYSNTNVDISGFIQTGNNIEWSGRLGVLEEKYMMYGFQPKSLAFEEDSLKVHFQTVRSRFGFRNINRSDLGISFTPAVTVDLFTDIYNNRETNSTIHVPLRKTLGGKFEAEVALNGDLTSYSPKGKTSINNHFFSVAPSVFVRLNNLNIQAGIRPAWDSAFKLFPNVTAEITAADTRLTFLLGWIGYMKKNSYQSLAAFNPWIHQPSGITTSRVEEIYGGIKGSVTDHFYYNARLGYNRFTNLPFFINDTAAGGKSFIVTSEPKVNAFNFRGEIGFTVGEKFDLKSGLTLNRYMGLKVNKEAWGLLPLEFTTSMRLQVLKDLYVKSDLFAFDSPWYSTKEGSGKLKGAVDMSAGLEFAVIKNVKLWAQFNNLFNNSYERWKQYPVYGFNFLGGVVFSFAQNNKSVNTNQ